MLRLVHSVTAVLILCLGLVTNASATTISGAYDYHYTSTIVDLACSSGARDEFSSTSGNNSLSSDAMLFSVCHGVPNALGSGEFSISDGGTNTASGTFAGVLTGLSAGNGDIFDGSFYITSESGYYSTVTASQGAFELVTGNVSTEAQLTGTFDFQSVPEPSAAILAVSGLVLAAVFRRKRASAS